MASPASYVVNEVQPESLRLKALQKFSCSPVDGAAGVSDEAPSSHVTRAIKSTLILGETQGASWWSGVGQALGWQAGDGGKVKLHVVLAQSQGDQSSQVETALCCFELYQACDHGLSEATMAFETLSGILGPLLEHGTILMTTALLSMLILPAPKEITDLPSALLSAEGFEVKQHLCTKFDGRTLLLLACEKGDCESTAALLDHGVDVLLADDKTGDTPLHTSSKQSSECLEHVLKHASKTLTRSNQQRFFDRKNLRGHTALDHACLHNQPKAVESLVKAGASTANPSPADKGYTGNPFHTAAAHDHHECISAMGRRDTYLSTPEAGSESDAKLKEKYKALNAADSHGDTPLIIAVTKGHVDSALELLLEGADPNCPNSSGSENPLAIASRESNITLVRLLLVFGANPSIPNTSGKTPLEEAEESSRKNEGKECVIAIKAVIEGQREAASVDVAVSTEGSPIPDADSVFILSFDGGGIRGLVLSQMFIVLEERMKKLHPNPPHISTFFDWIAGTSTGAYLALGFALYKSSPDLCRKMYFDFKKKAFAGHRVYPVSDIENCLKDAFGETKTLADIKTPKVCVATCLADRLPPELHLMCNYGEARNNQKSPSERRVWEACRASSAAPTYFPAFEKKFLDGGVMANNPTLDVLTEIYSEAKTQHRDVKIGCILSLGTGVVPTTSTNGGVNIVEPHGPFDLLHDIEALKNVVDLFISQSTISDGQETARARAWCDCMGTPYFRFSPPIDNIELNETDNEKLIKMLFDTLLYTFEKREEFDQLASLLLARSAR